MSFNTVEALHSQVLRDWARHNKNEELCLYGVLTIDNKTYLYMCMVNKLATWRLYGKQIVTR